MPEFLRQLQEEVARARSAYLEASSIYDALVDEIPHGRSSWDGNPRAAQAGETFRVALQAYAQAVNRLHDFVTTGKLPES